MGVLQQRAQHVAEHPTTGRLGDHLGDPPVVGRDPFAAGRRVHGLSEGADEVTSRSGNRARHATILPGRYDDPRCPPDCSDRQARPDLATPATFNGILAEADHARFAACEYASRSWNDRKEVLTSSVCREVTPLASCEATAD